MGLRTVAVVNIHEVATRLGTELVKRQADVLQNETETTDYQR